MLKTRIEEICLQVAEKLKDPEWIFSIASKKENLFIGDQLTAWDPLSLDYGYSGLIVFFSEMDAYFPGKGWKEELHRLVSLLIPEIKAKTHNNFSLFSGFAGVCFAIQIAAQRDSAFAKLDLTLCHLFFEQIKKTYLKSIEQLVALDHQPIPYQYDAITGVCCFLSYFLRYKHLPHIAEVIHQILKCLVKLSSSIQMGPHKIPGWYLSLQDPTFRNTLPTVISEDLLKTYPNGYFETGLAHGIAGCLAALSKASLEGIEVGGQREAIQRIAHWLMQTCQKVGPFQSVWPRRFGFNPEAKNYVEVRSDYYIDAWSHGSPGILNSLMLAAKVFNDFNLMNTCILGLEEVAERVQNSKTVTGLPFCYGMAGILSIFHRNSLVTENQTLINASANIAKGILDQYSPELPFGFKCEAPSNNEMERRVIDNPGLATGTIGVLLSLLYFNSKDHRPWLSIFQLN